MSDSLAHLYVIIGAKTEEFTKALKQTEKDLKKIERNFMELGKTFAAIGGVILAAGIKSAQTYANMGDEVQKMAIRTGFATEEISKLRYAAEISGTDIKAVETAIKLMGNTMLDAQNGLSTATRALDQLGISLQELQGMNPEQRFRRFMEAIAAIEDPTIKAALAVDVFGRSGTDLLPLLAEGADGLKLLYQEAEQAGVVFDQVAADKAAKFSDAITNLKARFDGLQNTIAESIIPVLNKFLENVQPIIENTKIWIEQHPKLVENILKVAAVLAVGGTLMVGISLFIKTVRTLITTLTVLQALSGPTGWATLGAGIGIAAGAIAAVNALTGENESQTSDTQLTQKTKDIYAAQGIPLPSYAAGGIVPGPRGAPIPVIAHGGEEFAGVGNHIGGSTTINITGNFMGNETEARQFARRIKQLIGEDDRRTQFSGVNRGYFAGGSHI